MIHRSPHLLILIAVLGLGTIWVTRFGMKQFESQIQRAATESGVPSGRPSQAPRFAGASPSSLPGSSLAVTREQLQQSLRKLSLSWLQESAQLELTPEGRLASIRQRGGPRSSMPYEPSQASQVLARARAFLGEASEVLGAASGTTLGDETVRADAHQGDVFFRQLAQGVPLAPHGSLSLTFGSAGELKSVAADLVPSPLELSGSFQLSPEVASRAAADSLLVELRVASLEAHEVKGGARRIWVQSREGGGFEGRPAYEFMVRGRKLIIDAQSGAVLFKRDRRIF